MTTQPAGEAPAPLQIGFGDRMRRLRINLGMTQDEFAEAIDISGATVGKYETQGRTPRMGKAVGNSVQLRFGRRYPDLDLKHWLLTGSSRQPTGYATRPRRPRLRLVRGMGGLPEVSHLARADARPTATSAA